MTALLHRRLRAVATILFILGGLVAVGCRAKDTRFVPSEETARQALDHALAAWQKTAVFPANGTLVVQKKAPAINFVDTVHQSGQKLSAATVLGPTTGDAERCYAVRLILNNPEEEVRARYVVLGLDPLWVMRYEDYEMVMHWDMHAEPSIPAPQKP